MTKEVLIDYRELKILKQLKNNHIKSNLDIGDIVFKENDKVILIIERKTISDLNSSIIDGRLREQKNRLLENYPKDIILYLIEGSNNESKFINSKSVNGSLYNIVILDNINIWKTNNLTDTIIFLEDLIDRFYTDSTPFKERKNSTPLIKCKKIKSTKDCFINQLCQIPGISNKISNIFSNKWNNMNTFIIELNNNPIDILSNINIGKRIIGNKLSNKIYYYLGIEKKSC